MMRRVGRPGLLGLAARTAVVAGTATAVSGAMSGAQQKKAQAAQQQQQYEAAQQQAQMDAAAQAAVQQQTAAQAAAAAPAPAAPGGDMMAQLQQLAQLHSTGVLSDDEFTAAKAKLLA
ncbi:SHOCT domain-containing protein [Microbacterium sp.]|uniref:SHOCT domain-containing protein n=1 Tax=Microbacterium sp. TaxID=51671 RepID=UPI003A90997E